MRQLKTFLSFAFFVLVGILLIRIVHLAIPISSNSPDFVAIHKTLQTYTELLAQANFTLDDSELTQVVANDLRGGAVDPIYLKSVQYVRGKPDQVLWNVGFLDVIRARYAIMRKARQLYEDALASGEVKIPTRPPSNENPLGIGIKGTDKDPYLNLKPNIESIPGIPELEQATGLVAGVPDLQPKKFRPMGFTLLSVYVDNDVAYAKVDWDYGLCEDTFVKKDGNWYLAGHKIIRWHAG